MINSVNLDGSSFQASGLESQKSAVIPQVGQKHRRVKNSVKEVPFGSKDRDSAGIGATIQSGILSLTDDLLGLFGFNAALWYIQSFVNGKLLIGKINKHYTKDINNTGQLEDLANQMKEKRGLQNVNIFTNAPNGEAFYTHMEHEHLPANSVVIGKDSYSSLFHELGHAQIENKTTFLRLLQRGRGNYAIIALALYALMNQNRTVNPNEEEHKGVLSKIFHSIISPTVIVPLAAFSPELITEAMASKYGLQFLAEKVKDKTIEKALLSKIKKSYITCFSTYLFIPVSIILMDALVNGVRREEQKLKLRRMQRMQS